MRKGRGGDRPPMEASWSLTVYKIGMIESAVHTMSLSDIF